MRNIDNIRKLDSEEFVEFIMETYINHNCRACVYNPNECKGNCREGMTKWLDAIDLEGTVLSKEEEAILNYCEKDGTYLEKDGIFIRVFGYEFNDDEEDDEEIEQCRLLVRDESLFSWLPDATRIEIKELLKIRQIVKSKEEKNIETNETLYNLIETCRKKLARIRLIRNGNKYRPIKNTRKEDVYEVLADFLHLFKMNGLATTYEVMQELQSGEIHKKGE